MIGRPVDRPAHLPRRIHIIGGSGVGKTWLADRLAKRTGLRVHHLDEVARVGGGTGPVRLAHERDPLVASILASDGWITEGIQLGWTEPLLARADLIVWLDTVEWQRASRRIATRFVRGAWAEMRRRSWRERVAHGAGYARSLRDLGVAMVGTRRYRAAGAGSLAMAGLGGADPSFDLADESRAATAATLSRYPDRVIHCRTPGEVDAVVGRISGAAR
jgi:cytidylate kinase